MEFEGQYLTYEEYVNLGGTLEITPFNLLELRARRIIDERTHSRLVGKGQDFTEVKACEFELIKSITKYQEMSNKQSTGISSESIDGYSVSYSTPSEEINKAQISEFNSIVEEYLTDTKINGVRVIWRGLNGN